MSEMPGEVSRLGSLGSKLLSSLGLTPAQLEGIDLAHPASIAKLIWKSPPLRALAAAKLLVTGVTEGFHIPGTNISLPGLNDLRAQGQITGQGIRQGARMWTKGERMGLNPFDQISTETAHAIVTGVASAGFRGEFADAMSEAVTNAMKRTGLPMDTALAMVVKSTREGGQTLTEFTEIMDHLHVIAGQTNLSITQLAEGFSQIEEGVSGLGGKVGAAALGPLAETLLKKYPQVTASGSQGSNLQSAATLQVLMGLRGTNTEYFPGIETTPVGIDAMNRGKEVMVRNLDQLRKAGGKKFEGIPGQNAFAAYLGRVGLGQTYFGTSKQQDILDYMRHTLPGLYGQHGEKSRSITQEYAHNVGGKLEAQYERTYEKTRQEYLDKHRTYRPRGGFSYEQKDLDMAEQKARQRASRVLDFNKDRLAPAGSGVEVLLKVDPNWNAFLKMTAKQLHQEGVRAGRNRSQGYP